MYYNNFPPYAFNSYLQHTKKECLTYRPLPCVCDLVSVTTLSTGILWKFVKCCMNIVSVSHILLKGATEILLQYPLVLDSCGWTLIQKNATYYSGFLVTWFCLFSERFRPALRPTHLPFQWVMGLFPKDKATKAWQPLPLGAMFKNEWSYTTTPPVCLLVWTGTTLPI